MTAGPARDGQSALAGNGKELVRERALAGAVQRGLERLYQLDPAEDVAAFVTPAEGEQREALLVREGEDGLELALRLPALARREFDVAEGAALDPLCQLIEGVSHFVYLADRASHDREATQLELELQAEVDKYIVLAASIRGLDARKSARLRARLYVGVSFVHDAASEVGQRYRLANDLAHKFVRRLERDYVCRGRFRELHLELRSFYRMGQEAKLRVGRDA